ncbi:MAG: pantoate--beta-alanine ligase [Chloroflexi bacterium]|nr:pantoate--beta-alanine ligase [Chloroflexota bacterium]
MKIVTTLPELRTARLLLPGPVGFVPTMGFLHAGHISLAQAARAECASVAASIFVNPTQFGPNEDLARYPRDLPRDLALLEAAGVDLVWTPTPEVMYPPGFQTWVEVEDLTRPLEGEIRPGHFRGVTTVVAKLFNAVGPKKAYFGQKDAQQAVVIRRMAKDLDFPVEVVICPTLREALVRATIAAEPRSSLQYVSCADYDTLEELETVRGKALLSMAVFVGKTRLIDNFVVG